VCCASGAVDDDDDGDYYFGECALQQCSTAVARGRCMCVHVCACPLLKTLLKYLSARLNGI